MSATRTASMLRSRATTAPGWRPLLLALVAVAAIAGVAACEGPAPAPVGANPSPGDRIHRQAQEALARWADAVGRSGGASITFAGEMTSQVGDWESSVGENNEAALLAGNVEAATPLPEDQPPRDEVRWLDGSKVHVSVLSAAAAFEDLVAAGDPTACPDCRPLRITDAQLATTLIETSRGPANAPTWVFSIAGTSVTVTRIAVDESVTVVPPPWNADDPPVGVSIEGATGSEDSRTLQVSFTGAVKRQDEPCGADYTTEAVESALAVVVIVTEHRNAEPGGCDAIGRTRTAEVMLKDPLGERAVLEIKQGLPVTVVAP